MPECGMKHNSHGYCTNHSYLFRQGKLPVVETPRTKLRRFLDARIEVDADTTCWNWTGLITSAGYGALQYERRKSPAHRFVWECYVGPIPDGHHIDHLCRNRRCVNPTHLDPVTIQENIARGKVGHRARSTDGKLLGCRKHGFTDGYIRRRVRAKDRLPSHFWFCRTCRREQNIRKREAA